MWNVNIVLKTHSWVVFSACKWGDRSVDRLNRTTKCPSSDRFFESPNHWSECKLQLYNSNHECLFDRLSIAFPTRHDRFIDHFAFSNGNHCMLSHCCTAQSQNITSVLFVWQPKWLDSENTVNVNNTSYVRWDNVIECNTKLAKR